MTTKSQPALYPAMSLPQMKKKAIDHWKEWRPKAVREMESRNALRGEALKAAQKAHKEMINMIQSGQPAHEAEDIVLKRYILLPPEKEVIEEMEEDD